MKRVSTSMPALLFALLRQSVETWSLESGAFLLYGLFMLVASFTVGQLPVAGLVLALALDGPLAGGVVLATRRLLLQERPEREDFLGGFRGWARAFGLATLALLVPLLGMAAWLAVSASQGWWTSRGWGWGIWLMGLAGAASTLGAAWFFTLSAQVLLLERRDLSGSLRRSAQLVSRRPFSVALLLILLVLAQVLLALPTLAAMLAGSEPSLMQWLPFLLGMGLLGPFQGILGTLLYFRLREEEGGTLAQG